MTNYDFIVDYELIDNMYNSICSTTKHRKKLIIFELNKFSNIIKIYYDLKKRNYKHGKYNIFLIKYPKYRVIMSENLYDKIINHLLSKFCLYPVINKMLISANIATRPKMGVDKGINYLKKVFNDIRFEYNDYYYLKCDISKYFYSIDHIILFNKLEKVITDKEVLNVVKDIVNSTDEEYVNKCINNLVNDEINKIKNLNTSLKSKESIINKLKKIPLYYKEKGLPIGNMSSQILAIFYLNDLDHLIKEKLHIKYYLRYMDDLLLFCKDKKYLDYCKRVIERELEKIKLKLNDKTCIGKLSNGINFLGYRFIKKNNKTIILMSKQMKKKINKRYRKDGKVIISRYNGYFKRCRSHKYKQKLIMR